MDQIVLLVLIVTVMVPPHLAILFDQDYCTVGDAQCTCATFSVTCSQRGLFKVPDFTPTGMSYTIVDLSHNNITTIKSAAFLNVSTIMLELSHNPLQTMANDALQGLEDVLENLQLEDCQLSEVPTAVGALNRLRILNLRHNSGITSLPGNVMGGIGMTLETLDFSNTGIAEWPLTLSTSIRLKKLLASGNHLTVIPNDTFHSFAATLEYLDLSYNEFRTFPDAINNLRVLKYIDLSFNLFGAIPADKFTYCRHSLQTLYLVHVMMREVTSSLKDLSALENLYLSYNPISSVSPDAFRGRIANSLKTLHIDKTILTAVPQALAYLTELTELNITWNRIQYLENYGIILPNLQTLYLDKNPITNVRSAAFNGVPALKRLYLRNTSLAFVPNSALAGASNLTFVDMSFNHFQALFNYGFPGMSELLELVLKGNPLATVEDDAFTDLQAVRVLNLEDCLLTEIPRAVQDMHSLRTLQISGNKIECTCTNLGWVNVWRANQGLIAKVEGICGNNDTVSIQYFIDNDGRSCA